MAHALLEKIKKNDIILASGSTINEFGIKRVHRCLCKVIEVGKYDIFAIHATEKEYNKPFRIPRARCQKVVLKETNLDVQVKNPKVGDLVLSISSYFGKVDQKIGRVKEIIDKPGSEKVATLIHSTKEHSVAYNSLIVLEE